NDDMAGFVAQDVVKTLLRHRIRIDTARVLVLGFTFKENCPDTRNTKVADMVAGLKEYVASVTIFDPLADVEQAEREHGLAITNSLPRGPYEAALLAVGHDAIASLGSARIRELLVSNGIIYDIKGVLPVDESDARI